MTLVMLAVLAVLVFFMFRNGRKRKAEQEKLQSTMVPGADVMTNFGLYGTIVSIDEVDNKVALEIAPGTVVHLHRQTVARVIEPVVEEPVVATDAEPEFLAPELNESHGHLVGEPEFGQRLDESDADRKKGDA
ncbi:preprotein translocase subunit YajC [Cryobacterium tepidiphilum]|jgi:preprotein translocase subunit YajC|nr:preprotein translocase subunit YajC [Cryobacterium tepidiphilum]